MRRRHPIAMTDNSIFVQRSAQLIVNGDRRREGLRRDRDASGLWL
jgi:hypothetical protein